MIVPDRVYLGDGAYARVGHERGEIILTTENGISVQNTIHIGTTELVVLLDWLQAQGIIKWQMWSAAE